MKKRIDPSTPRNLDEARDDPRFVTALGRGLELLRCFRMNDRGLGNQELAERASLPKSTVSRLTYTLAAMGYLHYSSDTGRYSLAPAVLALGFSALGGLAIRDVARPLLVRIAALTGVSTALAVPDERTMVYIESCRGSHPLQLGIEVGSHIKMANSSLGRAYLAALDPDARQRRVALLCAADPAGADAITRGVVQAVAEYEEHGYVTSLSEWREEINSVGVPLVLPGGYYYAMNCGGSAQILRTDNLAEAGRQLRDAAYQIKLELM